MSRSNLRHRISFFVVHHVLHADDTPSRIARGVAIGVFVAWLPLIGLQMLIVLGLSFIFRANKVVGLPIVWISNPFTFGPIYYPSYLLGSNILKSHAVSIAEFEQNFVNIFASSMPLLERLRAIADLLFTDIYYPTFVGALVIGAVLGLTCYLLTVWTVRGYRRRRIARRARRLSRVSERIKPPDDYRDSGSPDQAEPPQSKAG